MLKGITKETTPTLKLFNINYNLIKRLKMVDLLTVGKALNENSITIYKEVQEKLEAILEEGDISRCIDKYIEEIKDIIEDLENV